MVDPHFHEKHFCGMNVPVVKITFWGLMLVVWSFLIYNQDFQLFVYHELPFRLAPRDSELFSMKSIALSLIILVLLSTYSLLFVFLRGLWNELERYAGPYKKVFRIVFTIASVALVALITGAQSIWGPLLWIFGWCVWFPIYQLIHLLFIEG